MRPTNTPAQPGPSLRTAPGRRRVAQGLLALLLGGAASLLLAELVLRVHNPVEVRILESEIRLPVRRKVVYRDPGCAKLDREIVCSHNVLGFRGPDPPARMKDHLAIVAVGGSTTECRYLSDGKTWTDLLQNRLALTYGNVWVNNAGLDGHSTFGHTILLEQVLLGLAPDYLLLLVGLNDTDRGDLNRRDASLIGKHTVVGRVVDASELLSTLRVLSRTWRARERGLQHLMDLDLTRCETRTVSPEEITLRVDQNRRKAAVPAYAARLRHLIAIARQGGIEPVLLTQPALFGEGVDPTTGVELGPLVFGRITGLETWRVIEIYNDVTRSVGKEQDVLVVDLARRLPKDSAFYYDWMHFTNEGADRVAELIERYLDPFLAARGHERLADAAPPR